MLTRSCTIVLLAAAVLALAGCGSTHHAPEYLSFHSAPQLSPPKLFVTHADKDPAAGDIFIAPKGGRQALVEIADAAGQPVWLHRVPTGGATDFTVQQLDGQPVLTWWEGRSQVGYGAGMWQVYDTHYEPVTTIRAGNGLSADEHELQIEPDGTAFVDAYHTVRMDLRPYGGPKKGFIEDGIAQRVNIKTGKVVWQWSALAHVALDRTYLPIKGVGTAKKPWDFFHINSVDLEPGGRVLISSRNTHAVYEVDGSTGAVEHVIGGKHPTYHMGAGTQFAWQHDARRQTDGTITLFDDAAAPATEPYTRALTLRIDDATNTVTLAHADVSPEHLLSSSQGNVQRLADGNDFVGYGAKPYFEEFDPAGHVLLDLHFTATGDSYRAFRRPWTGEPTTVPDIKVTPYKVNGVTTWVSWNGAADVHSWRLLGGADMSRLAPISETSKQGFETALHLSKAMPYVEVQALDAQGHVLATSLPAATTASRQ